MKLSNLQLLLMHPVCKYSKAFIRICIVSACLLSCGCTKEVDGISLGQWIETLNEEAGISQYQQSQPYFITIPKENAYYEVIQAAVEWGVLQASDKFDIEQTLDKQWVAYTVCNLIGNNETHVKTINDISSSRFPNQVQQIVDLGWMEVNQNQNFCGDAIISSDEAAKVLHRAVNELNQKTFDSVEPNIVPIDGGDIKENTPIAFDVDSLQGVFLNRDHVQQGDYVHFRDVDGIEYSFKVIEIQQDENQTLVKFSPIEVDEEFAQIQVAGNQELDFSQADIFASEGVQQQFDEVESAQNYIHNASVSKLQKTFQINNFSIQVQGSGSSISAKVYRLMPHGTEISAKAILNHVHVNYAWNSEKKDLKNAYFRLDFQSEEDLSIENEVAKKLYGDFSKVDSSNFLSTLKNLYQAKNDAEETELTICKITLPIPGAPILNVQMSLNLKMSVTGKVELSLVQQNALGFETKNGNMRLIKENTGKADASVKAQTKLAAGIQFAFCLLNGKLMDAGIEAGAKAYVKATAHLYDSEGNMNNVETEIPADTVESAADSNDNVFICTDVKAHWLLEADFNSSSTIAGKFGLGKEFSILDEDNAPLIPGLNSHFENGHAVEKCTRTSRKHLPTAEGIQTTKRICLSQYSFSVHIGYKYQIHITGLPTGYTESDLIYESSNEQVATVDQSGNVIGKEAGSVVITVHTSDKKHNIHCNVIVPTS